MAAANDIIFDAHDIAASNIESAARSTLPSSPQAAAQFTDTEKMHVYEKLFDDPEISHGVMDLSNIPCNQVGCLHSFTHLINLRSTTGWGPTVFQNIQVLNVSHNGLNGGDLSPLCRALSNQDLNLKVLDLSFNRMCDNSVFELLESIEGVAHRRSQKVEILKLNNNDFGDLAAEKFYTDFRAGKLAPLKSLDVSGNHITPEGQGLFARAMQNPIVQDVVVIVKDLEKNFKFIFGTREEKVAEYRDIIDQARGQGVEARAIVVNKNLIQILENHGVVGGSALVGFVKCHWSPESLLTEYVEGKLIAKLPTTLSRVISTSLNARSVVSCYLTASHDAWMSEPGLELLTNELCVMGETEYCGSE